MHTDEIFAALGWTLRQSNELGVQNRGLESKLRSGRFGRVLKGKLEDALDTSPNPRSALTSVPSPRSVFYRAGASFDRSCISSKEKARQEITISSKRPLRY